MKIPQYLSKTTRNWNGDAAIKAAAKALEIDASVYSKMNNRVAAGVLRNAAVALRAVADGKTFVEAFEWSDDDAAQSR